MDHVETIVLSRTTLWGVFLSVDIYAAPMNSILSSGIDFKGRTIAYLVLSGEARYVLQEPEAKVRLFSLITRYIIVGFLSYGLLRWIILRLRLLVLF